MNKCYCVLYQYRVSRLLYSTRFVVLNKFMCVNVTSVLQPLNAVLVLYGSLVHHILFTLFLSLIILQAISMVS